MSLYDIAQSYMILGGIPYYLGMFEPDCSLAQNIDNLFFSKDAKLEDEFDLLFGSLLSIRNSIRVLFGFWREGIRDIVEKRLLN